MLTIPSDAEFNMEHKTKLQFKTAVNLDIYIHLSISILMAIFHVNLG